MVKISTVEDLMARLLAYDSGWMFRGHARESWKLAPTLERALAPATWQRSVAEACEKLALHRFEAQAHHYLSSDTLPETTLGRLALLQHHGVPTRLLDFTTASFVALFFAIQGVAAGQSEPCCVWAVNYREIMSRSLKAIREVEASLNWDYTDAMARQDELFEEVVLPGELECLWVTEPRVLSFRLERQKGTFLLSSTLKGRLEDLVPQDDPALVQRISVPIDLRRSIVRLLASMGLDNSRLFGDIDGFARDLRDEMSFHVEELATSNCGSEPTPAHGRLTPPVRR